MVGLEDLFEACLIVSVVGSVAEGAMLNCSKTFTTTVL